MKTILRPVLLAAACAVAFPSMAADRCEHSRSEAPALDLSGVTQVRIDIGADELVVTAGAPKLSARHCASTPDRLANSAFKVERRGSELLLSTSTASFANVNWFADSDYLHREITLALPADLPLALSLGSGDAAMTGLSTIDIDLGSGDVTLRQVGRVRADIGSGDLRVDGATSVSVAVGSGDAVLKRLQGEVRADVGAGDVEMHDVGPIATLDVGSGGIRVQGVRGDARIGSVGSGDVELKGVRGRVHVGGIGSGEVTLDGVDGDVTVADKDAMDAVDTRNIGGRIIIGG